MFILDKIPPLQLGISGLDAGFTEEEKAIQEVTHRFAEEVMRPIAEKLDKMTPEEVRTPGSPLYEYLGKLQEVGIFDMEAVAAMSGEEKARILPIIFEELGWGDTGLAVAAALTALPTMVAYRTGNPELIETFAGKIGCSIATLPDRGSDFFDLQGDMLASGSKQHRGNLTAKIEDDHIVLNGQSSSWVSCAGIAQATLAFIPCDYGKGIFKENGATNCVALLANLEVDGVSKGKALDALGQRSLAQCEIFFDEVRYPLSYIIAGEDNIEGEFFATISFANMEMGSIFTGLARAAYEHALAYCHERIQGGVPIIEHQSVKSRLFGMWEKVEAARALSRRVANFNHVSEAPHLVASVTSKSFVTRTCFEVTSEALQLFGANGLTKEYPIEKLFRDARASMIEDGENNLIGMKAMHYLSEHYKNNH